MPVMPLSQASSAKRSPKIPRLFWWPSLVVVLFLTLGAWLPLEKHIAILNAEIFRLFGGFYLLFVWLTLLGFVGIGLSPLGKLRLGEGPPEHGFFSWFAMLFCAGMGTGLMFWGAAEPLYHFSNPPLSGVQDPETIRRIAFQYTFFHWGLNPWAIYGMTALALGLLGFNHGRGFFFSGFFRSGKGTGHGFMPELVDGLTIVAIVFGMAATLGMGVLQVTGGLHALAGWGDTPVLQMAVLAMVTVAYLASALRGVDAGIKTLSNINLGMCLLLLALVVWLGPKETMVSAFGFGLRDYLAALPAMSLGSGAFQDPHWVSDWTVKYWSWWIAWAPFVGLFIASISKGRSLRELVIGVLAAPTLFSCLWFSVFGAAAIQGQSTLHLFGQIIDWQNVNSILFTLLAHLSHEPLIGWLSLALVGINFINSADSATYTIACFSRRDLEASPPKRLLILWGILFAVLAGMLLFAGGIGLLQQVTLITVLPFTLILSLVFLRTLGLLLTSASLSREK